MKFLISMLLLGLCFGGYKAYEGKQLLSDAKKALADAELRLAFSREHLMTRTRELQSLQSAADQARVQSAETERLTQQKAELTSKLVAAQKEMQSLRASVHSKLELGRAASASAELPELELTSGKKLLNVKFRRLDDQQASLSHRDGMVTIPVDLLPQDIIERFGIGNSALLAELDSELAKVNAYIEGKPSKISTNQSRVKPLSPLAADEQRVKGLVVHCPVTFHHVVTKFDEPAIESVQSYQAELPSGLVVAVHHLELKPNTDFTLDKVPNAAVANIMKLPGMHRPNHQKKEYTISGQPAWRSTFTALRQRTTGVITVYMDAVYVQKGDLIWIVQAIFTSDTPGNRPHAEKVIHSVRLD